MIAGIGSGTYQQIDDTFARVNGANHYPPILCDQYYAAFFTTLLAFEMPQKDRKQINIHVEKNKAVDEACFEGWLSSTGK